MGIPQLFRVGNLGMVVSVAKKYAPAIRSIGTGFSGLAAAGRPDLRHSIEALRARRISPVAHLNPRAQSLAPHPRIYSKSRRLFFRFRFRAKACLTRFRSPGFK